MKEKQTRHHNVFNIGTVSEDYKQKSSTKHYIVTVCWPYNLSFFEKNNGEPKTLVCDFHFVNFFPLILIKSLVKKKPLALQVKRFISRLIKESARNDVLSPSLTNIRTP